MKRVLLIGPPGSGKLLRARALCAALPAPSPEASVSLAWLYSRSAAYRGEVAPFRAPHHTVSEAGLIGGGVGSRSAPVYPGEVSLAHAGCLLLDELPEFRGSVIESLGNVLRTGVSRFYRGGEWTSYPASPALLVATATCERSPAYAARWEERLVRMLERLGGPWERETLTTNAEVRL